MSKFGKMPRPKKFSPPTATRGGYTGFFNVEKEKPLSGMVQNIRAAKGEERACRTLDKSIKKGIVSEYKFRWTTGPRDWVNAYKELDILVTKTNGEVVAISVKGKEFVHLGATATAQDKLNEIIILKKLHDYGMNVPRIDTVYDLDLTTQADADKAMGKLGLYR